MEEERATIEKDLKFNLLGITLDNLNNVAEKVLEFASTKYCILYLFLFLRDIYLVFIEAFITILLLSSVMILIAQIIAKK